MITKLLALPSTVWTLGFVSLLNDAASDMVYPLLPLYLASVLGAGPAAIGLIEGVAESVSSVCKLLSGLIADRIPRSKPLVVIGYALAAISRPLIVLAATWPLVLLLRFVDRVGKGLRSAPRDAILAASIEPSRRGLAFGLQRGMDNAGAVVGPLIAWVLLRQGTDIADIIVWTAVPGLLTVALAGTIDEPLREKPSTPAGFSISVQWMPVRLKRYLLVLALFSLGNSSNMFLLLQAKSVGISESQIPLLWGLASLTATLLSPLLAGLSDSLGRTRLISLGWILYGLFYLALGFQFHFVGWIWGAFASYGVFMAATEGAEKALIADFAPTERLGSAYGWFNLTTGITLLPASLLFGTIWEFTNPMTAFGFAAACSITAAILLKHWVRA